MKGSHKKRKKIKSTLGEKKPDKRGVIALLAVLTAVSITVMIFALEFTSREMVGEFIPPEHDHLAQNGVPEVSEELGYYSPYADGMSYRFSVCGNVTVQNSLATVYLTNPAENDVYIKVRILDLYGNILGESGILYPGEYVRDVNLTGTVYDSQSVVLKIMGYEMDTYYSAGSVTVNTKVALSRN